MKQKRYDADFPMVHGLSLFCRYVLSMYGFGLCETGQLAEAEKYVRSVSIIQRSLFIYSQNHNSLTLTTIKYVCINHGTKGFFQFEIIISVLVSFFCFIRIYMLGVYSHYNFFQCWDRLLRDVRF